MRRAGNTAPAVLLSLLAAMAGTTAGQEEIAMAKGLLLIAHRGVVDQTLTENSLPSLEEAIRRGYTHVEIDVRCTRDGHTVCLHDASLKRVSGLRRNVHEVTLAELRALVDEETVPAFDTYCRQCRGRIGLMPDLKGCPAELEDAYLKSIETALVENELMAGALFIGQHVMARHFLGKGRLVWSVPVETARRAPQIPTPPGALYFIFGHAANFTADNVKGYQELGLQVVVSINTHHYRSEEALERGKDDIRRMLAWGVDGLQIDSVYDDAVFGRETPQDGAAATLPCTKVLCREPGRYIGWPSIALAPNGDLLAVFSGDRTAHISPDGKVQMVRSSDGGETWSGPATVHDTPIDDRDSGIIQTAKGTMLVCWFTNPGGGEWQGHWVVRSTDNGQTWGLPIRTEVTTPHGPIQLRDGRLLFVGQRPHESHGKPFDVGIQESRDDGLTWQTIGTFPVPEGAPMLSYDEGHVVERGDGLLLILFRDCYEPHYLRQSESTDGGHTWSAPSATKMHGYPPHVIRLQNGWLLASYAKRWEPYGEYACVSRDNGATWDVDHEIRLAEALDGDLGYPASVQLADETIWTVYYQANAPGEKPCLMGTHWRLPGGHETKQ